MVPVLNPHQCVPENLDCKRSIIKQLDNQADPDIIIASNSSSYSITEACDGLEFKADDRFVNLHSCQSPLTQHSSSFTNRTNKHTSPTQSGHQKHEV